MLIVQSTSSLGCRLFSQIAMGSLRLPSDGTKHSEGNLTNTDAQANDDEETGALRVSSEQLSGKQCIHYVRFCTQKAAAQRCARMVESLTVAQSAGPLPSTINEIVDLSYKMSTVSSQEISFYGIKMLNTIITAYSHRDDPQLEGHKLIEQYQVRH